ncbi:NAD-dependent deacylase [Desulfobacterales bacterium HSG16]|nr:NAD-dependent deacylase [Desulfobacterales bacterium HSG16]
MDDMIKKAAKDIVNGRHVVALTGAGCSVESGIPPFRGKGGVWEKIDPMKYAHIDYFMKEPEDVWRVLIGEMKNVIDRSKPNDAHKGLARLEEMGILKTIITQNVDGLHQLAGNIDVIEFHGTFAWLRCLKCGKRIKTSDVDMTEIPPRCECRGIWRPECIFFGEMIPYMELVRSREEALSCDVMLVIGTSATVQPVASMPLVAKEGGAVIIEINAEKTPLTEYTSDYIVQGRAGQVMRSIVEEVEKLKL